MSLDTYFSGMDLSKEDCIVIKDIDDAVEQDPDSEYGKWTIDLSKLPKDTTHILIERF